MADGRGGWTRDWRRRKVEGEIEGRKPRGCHKGQGSSSTRGFFYFLDLVGGNILQVLNDSGGPANFDSLGFGVGT